MSYSLLTDPEVAPATVREEAAVAEMSFQLAIETIGDHLRWLSACCSRPLPAMLEG